MNQPEPVRSPDSQALLRRYGLRAEKGLSQNFLEDPEALERIVRAAEIGQRDAVLEIGPGLGGLTRRLAAAARRVVAVELDARLVSALSELLASLSNVEIVQGDILKLQPAELIGEAGYKVVANIPYHITSALIRHLLAPKNSEGKTNRPERLVLTLQKEVAERICAGAGYLSLLALSVQIFGRPTIAGVIPANAFYPVPKVDSACLRVDVYEAPLVPDQLLDSFFRVARAGFSQKRKTLRNSLAGGLRMPPGESESWLRGCGIDPMRRAETLSIEEWGRLAASLDEVSGKGRVT
jgi:16S rRNA (adenine1518-N6/adenine1519-N6)-dimethyltransferase